LEVVDAAKDIAEFLASRRAKVTPEQAGLPPYGPRRVPGLRREGGRFAGRRRASQQRVRPVVQRIVDAMTTPAIVRNSRVDYLAAKPARPRALRPGLRQPGAAREQRPLHILGPRRSGQRQRVLSLLRPLTSMQIMRRGERVTDERHRAPAD
jgi:hypothetical protein